MNLQQSLKSPRGGLAIALHVVAAGVGLLAGYDFGARVGGPLGGVVAALCGAAFCSLLAEGTISRLVLRPPR